MVNFVEYKKGSDLLVLNPCKANLWLSLKVKQDAHSASQIALIIARNPNSSLFQNRLEESLTLFQAICNNKFFINTSMVSCIPHFSTINTSMVSCIPHSSMVNCIPHSSMVSCIPHNGKLHSTLFNGKLHSTQWYW